MVGIILPTPKKPSWPGIAVCRTASLPLAYARPSTSSFSRRAVRCRHKAGHDEGEAAALQPPLPPLKAFQILKTLALVAGAAEVKLLDVLIVAQLVGAAIEHHLALLHDVAVACDRQRGARVLLHQIG